MRSQGRYIRRESVRSRAIIPAQLGCYLSESFARHTFQVSPSNNFARLSSGYNQSLEKRKRPLLLQIRESGPMSPQNGTQFR